MRIRLSIDEEFRQIAPPISKAEHDELEKSLIAEGCRDATHADPFQRFS